MQWPTLEELDAAASIVYEYMQPTPQYAWAQLEQLFGMPVWVKHENVSPLGAFKMRGGLVYVRRLVAQQGPVKLVSATRGNHGQSIAFAGRANRVPVTIVVPKGNSMAKNTAMQALGADLRIGGDDFQAAREFAANLAREEGGVMVPSFHPDLVMGVASYALELLRAVPDLKRIYVPIGMGSGAAGVVYAKHALQHPVEIIGVTSAHAPAYARAFETGDCTPMAVSTWLADGLACRSPDPQAVEVIRAGVSRIVEVSDDEVVKAIRLLADTTHHMAEGAGAAAMAAALQDKDAGRLCEGPMAVVMSGGNIDTPVLKDIFSQTPCTHEALAAL
ncbi:threonine dehydratase [Leeia oryzae]|uniref:threonine dehydratase n=1 Tax=Leeia oryzae TaxID=356662 RepID=UPI0003793AD2|nr:threonine dehydratase [Leeia oryzae]